MGCGTTRERTSQTGVGCGGDDGLSVMLRVIKVSDVLGSGFLCRASTDRFLCTNYKCSYFSFSFCRSSDWWCEVIVSSVLSSCRSLLSLNDAAASLPVMCDVGYLL